jgi:hypothetical protein
VPNFVPVAFGSSSSPPPSSSDELPASPSTSRAVILLPNLSVSIVGRSDSPCRKFVVLGTGSDSGCTVIMPGRVPICVARRVRSARAEGSGAKSTRWGLGGGGGNDSGSGTVKTVAVKTVAVKDSGSQTVKTVAVRQWQ